MLTAASAPPTSAPPDSRGPASNAPGGRKDAHSPSTLDPRKPPNTAPGGGSEDGKPASGRTSRGRFAKGNPGGPGNPHARRVAALKNALLDVVTEDEIRDVAAELLEQAREGDVAAARLLFSYTIGKPAQSVDPDRLDIQEWELFRQEAGNMTDLDEVLNRLPVAQLCQIARASLSTLQREVLEEVLRFLKRPPADLVAEPHEEVEVDQPFIPEVEDVLPPRPKRGGRTDPTTTPDASPVVPPIPAASGGTQTTPVAEESPPCAAAVPQVAPLRRPREDAAVVQDSSRRAPSVPVSLPTGPVAQVREDDGKHGTDDSVVCAAGAAAGATPRHGVERLEEALAQRGGPGGMPLPEARLQQLLRQLGLRDGPLPSPNRDYGRAAPTEDDGERT